MTVQRCGWMPAALAAAFVLAGAPGLLAQERPLFEWSGRVDREVRLVMRGGALQPQADRREYFARSMSRVRSELPRQDGLVSVRTNVGRGIVDIVQQPAAANDYTAIVRIRDDAAGADQYHLSAFWAPAGRAGRYGDARDRDRDDRGRHLGWERGKGNQDRVHDQRGEVDRRDEPRAGRDEPRAGRDERRSGQSDRPGRTGAENAVAAGNAGPGALHWRGAVDDQVDILFQGRQVRYAAVRGNGTRDVTASGELPARPVSLTLVRREGRGQIVVVQQPTAANGYVAIVRIRDAAAGMGYYDFDVSW